MVRALLAFFLFVSLEAHALTILIDPGHGGEDTGATGTFWSRVRGQKKKEKVLEKDLSLAISKLIYSKLRKKKFNVFLTRSLDRTVTLEERAELAEKVKADLFISVHINSSSRRGSRGFETYYLDNNSDAAVKKVEEVENANLKGDELIVRQILTDLVIDRTVVNSKRLAKNVHHFVSEGPGRRYKMRDRGVKAGLFYVLALSKRPGLLLEAGFLSNSREIKKLSSNSFQDSYAEAVVSGIVKYIEETKKPLPPLF